MTKRDQLLHDATYDPNTFMDWLLHIFESKSDADLARKLEVGSPVISNIRHKRLAIGAQLLVRVSDYTGMGTSAIKAHMYREAA